MVDSSKDTPLESRPEAGGAIVPSHGNGYAPMAFADGVTGFEGAPLDSASAQQLIARIFGYKWTIALLSLLVMCTAIPAIWILVVPQYRANAVIRVSPVIQRVLFQLDDNRIMPLYTSYLNTQVQLILSPKVLERVLDRAEVQQTAWYKDDKPSLFKSPLPKMNRLLRSLSARPRLRTELIDVSMTTSKPGDAKLIVDAVVEEYAELHFRAERKSSSARLAILTGQLESLKSEIDVVLDRKDSVSKVLGASEPEELRVQLTTRLSALEVKLSKLERTYAMAQWELSRIEAMKKEAAAQEPTQGEETRIEVSPSESILFAGDKVWLSLTGDCKSAQHRLKQARERYGESHPRLRDLIAQAQYSEDRLRDRENQLRNVQAAGGEAILDPSDAAAARSESALKYHLSRADYEGVLLERQIDAVKRTGELARELVDAEDAIKRKRELFKSVRQRLDELEMESSASAAGRVSIAAKALRPAIPSKDRRILMTVMAVFGGLGLGFGVAFLRVTLDTSLRWAEDVASATRVPFLGQLPKTSALDLLESPDGLLVESLRMVRTALLERVTRQEGGCSVLITSPTSQSGKTTLTIMLGRCLAQLGKKVLLVDGDLRRSSLTEYLCHEGEMGLTTVLHGQASWEQVVLPTEIPGVDIIPVGQFHSKADLELMANGVFAKCMVEWQAAYDFVLLDSPPVLPVADARILAGQVDGTILTIRASHSRRADAMESLDRLRAAGAELFGTVLVGTEIHSRYYGAHDDYAYYYTREPKQLVKSQE